MSFLTISSLLSHFGTFLRGVIGLWPLRNLTFIRKRQYMVRTSLLLIIQFFIAAVGWAQADLSSSTGEPCPTENNLDPSQQLGTLSETAQNAACIQTYRQKRCEEFKQSLDPEDQSKVITCSERDSLTAGKVLLSCGAGLKDFVVDTATGIVYLVSQLPHLPGAIMAGLQRAGEFGKKCEEDQVFRSSLFEAVAPLYSENDRKALLEQVSCDGLLTTIRQQSTQAMNEIIQKKQLQERFTQRYPNGERSMPDHIKLTPGEEEFQRRYMQAADAEKSRLNGTFSKVWNQVQTEIACYNTAAKVEIVCSILAEQAATVATGGVVAVASRSARVRQIVARIKGSLSADDAATLRGGSVGSGVARESGADAASASAASASAERAGAAATAGRNPSRSAARVGMTPDERARTLAATSRMSRTERMEYTEKVFGRKLDPKEQDVIWKVHKMGEDSLKSQGRYSDRDLLEKRRELVKSGYFSEDEINQLMRRGITGETGSGFATTALGQSTVKDVLERAGVQREVIERYNYIDAGKTTASLSGSESQRVIDTLTAHGTRSARAGDLNEARSIYQTAYDMNLNVAQTALKEGRDSVADSYFTRSFAFKDAWAPSRSMPAAHDELVKASVQSGYFNKIGNKEGFEQLYNPMGKSNLNSYDPRAISLHGKSAEEVYLSNNRQVQELRTLKTLREEARNAPFGTSKIFSDKTQVPAYLHEISDSKLSEYIRIYEANLKQLEASHFRKPQSSGAK